jgi:hypothetical protein
MVTRTLNPLHFEDLEPHRFEDLIRQLAYGFRTWRSLEATGRKGNDEGVDIRGMEIVQEARLSDEEGGAGESPSPSDREWRFQVKRYKELGPADMRKIVVDALSRGPAPYGLVAAVGCDVSADALAAFREEALSRGLVQAHVWMGAHLEDMLYLPENDRLLFGYFGVSLRTRERGRLTEVRAAISIKRKLRQALGVGEFGGMKLDDVLVRDVECVDFLHPRHLAEPVPPAQSVEIYNIAPGGLVVRRFRCFGVVKLDGTWDFDPTTRWSAGNRGFEFWEAHAGESNPLRRPSHSPLGSKDPQIKIISELRFIPYDDILEVDPDGDDYLPITNLICRFAAPEGPYTREPMYMADDQELDPSLRRGYCQTPEWSSAVAPEGIEAIGE